MFAGTKAVEFVGIAILCLIAPASMCSAQNKPVEDCLFAYDGFATSPGEKIQLAEVSEPNAMQLETCGTPRGCLSVPVAQGTPVQVYRQHGAWTCGYVSGNNGSGPAWILNTALRIHPYNENPPLAAWVGVWKGGEDHVRIRLGTKPGTLLLAGTAVWHGNYSTHTGDATGSAVPVGNRLHFVEAGPDSCTIDLVLLDTYILAEDNNACGGMNVRFQGIWKRGTQR
jgi:hypothetical protein